VKVHRQKGDSQLMMALPVITLHARSLARFGELFLIFSILRAQTHCLLQVFYCFAKAFLVQEKFAELEVRGCA
jgi:hypothetical protein